MVLDERANYTAQVLGHALKSSGPALLLAVTWLAQTHHVKADTEEGDYSLGPRGCEDIGCQALACFRSVWILCGLAPLYAPQLD